MIKNFLLLIALTIFSYNSFGGAGTFPQGDHVKQLKDKIEFKNTLTQIITNDSDDPTSVAKSADIGSLYIKRDDGKLYSKTDNGSSTNWIDVINGTGTALTQGSIPFANASGNLTQDNTNLFWDDTNNRLGVLTNTPTVPLEVGGNALISGLTTTTGIDLTSGGLEDDNTSAPINLSDGANISLDSAYSASTILGAFNEVKFASGISVPTIGTPTYIDQEDHNTITANAGWISGGVVSDNGDGTVDVTAGTGLIRSSNSETAQLLFFDWAAVNNLALTADSENYIYVDYNAGSPIVTVTTTGSTVRDNENDRFELSEIFLEGATTAHITSHKQHASIGRLYQIKDYEISKIDRASGLILGETGTRNITVTAGVIWIKLDRSTTAAFDSSGADTFDRYYRDGVGGWIKTSGQTQWDNLQYDDGSGTLVTMTNNRWSTQYFYADADGDIVSIYGQAEYVTEGGAEIDTPPTSLPERLEDHALLIGRIVFQKSAATGRIESAFDTTFNTTVVTDHGELAGLSDDDHTQYPLLAGRSGGQTLNGGTDASDNITINSTSNATKGSIILQDLVTANDSMTIDTSLTVNNGTNAVGTFAVLKSGGGNAISYDYATDIFRLDSSTQVYNETILNAGNSDFDFTVNKNTSGEALDYDAGLDTLTINSATSFTAGVTTDGEVVFNELGAAVDFRVEGDTEPNLLFVDGSADFIGIGTNAPTVELDLVGSLAVSVDADITGDLTAATYNGYTDNELLQDDKSETTIFVKNALIDGTTGSFTGNNSDFDGGGTIDGTFSASTDGKFYTTTEYKYVASTSSDNDYLGFTYTVTDIAEDNLVKFFTTYQNSSGVDDDEVRFAVKINGGTLAGQISYYDIEKTDTAGIKEFRFQVPSDATSLDYGFQNVSMASGDIFYFDKIGIDLRPYGSLSTVETEYARYDDHAGYGSTNNKIPYYTNERVNGTGKLVSIENSSTNGFSVTALESCSVTFDYTFTFDSSGQEAGVSLNSTQLTTAIGSITAADRVAYEVNSTADTGANLSITIDLDAGDVLRPHTGGVASSTSSPVHVVSITAKATKSNVVDLAQDGMAGWTSYTPSSTQGFGTTTNNSFHWRREGSDMIIRGTFTTGTVTASEARISLPSGYTSIAMDNLEVAGTAYHKRTLDGSFEVYIGSEKTYLNFGLQTAGDTGLTVRNGNQFASGSSDFGFLARVPIKGWSKADLLVGVQPDKLDNNEKIVGTWFGETLYERSFTWTGSASSSFTLATIDTGLEIVDHSFCSKTGNSWYSDSLASNFNIDYNQSTGVITMGIAAGTYTEIRGTLRYTK